MEERDTFATPWPWHVNTAKTRSCQYYNDPVVRYGYLRGEETYGYVTSIRERWQRYRAAVHGGTTGGVAPAPSRKNSHGGFKSKVLSAEELEAKSKQNTP